MAAWLDCVNGFLETYSQGKWPVRFWSLELELNQTALSALPMIRRSILAQLALAYLTRLHERLPPEHGPRLAQFVRKMYDMHKAAVDQKGCMEYFHISKAGGTSWNAAAKLNGCVRSMFVGSHVRGFGDECRWMDQAAYNNVTGHQILWGRWGRVARRTPFGGCERRYLHILPRGFSYTSNEYTLLGGKEGMYDAHVCPHLVNVVTIRNPIRRMESNIRFVMMHVKKSYRRRGEAAKFEAIFCNASAALWEALAPPVTDNYLVRSFLGEQGFHTPFRTIGEEHVAVARQQLLQFDLVLDLDAGEEAGDRMAQQGLGWPAALSRAHVLDSSVMAISMDLNYTVCHPEEAGLEHLKHMQAPDMQFYNFGRVVNQLDELWLDMARALGLRPVARDLDPEAPPEEIRCGLLWRGSNSSALARAIREALGPDWLQQIERDFHPEGAAGPEHESSEEMEGEGGDGDGGGEGARDEEEAGDPRRMLWDGPEYGPEYV